MEYGAMKYLPEVVYSLPGLPYFATYESGSSTYSRASQASALRWEAMAQAHNEQRRREAETNRWNAMAAYYAGNS
jgi:hypothetical protein